MRITWKHSDTDLAWPLTVEQKIDIFYEQLRGWGAGPPFPVT